MILKWKDKLAYDWLSGYEQHAHYYRSNLWNTEFGEMVDKMNVAVNQTGYEHSRQNSI